MKSARFVTVLAVLVSLALPATASANFPLRGWWPLNEGKGQTVRDWSGKRNHGFLGSTPAVDSNDPSWTKGIFFGSALSFGGDDFISIDDSGSLEPQQITVGAWMKASQSPGTYRYLIAKGTQECVASSYGLMTGWHGGLQFYVWDGYSQVYSGWHDASIYDGRWHHVAGTYDGTAVRLFVDGREIGSSSPHDRPIDYLGPDGAATIGGYHGSCDLMFSGEIDDVHIWSQALPVDQIWRRWGWLLGFPGRQ
jgi:Concanavalin A-like lectin/glucanases superfamily